MSKVASVRARRRLNNPMGKGGSWLRVHDTGGAVAASVAVGGAGERDAAPCALCGCPCGVWRVCVRLVGLSASPFPSLPLVRFLLLPPPPLTLTPYQPKDSASAAPPHLPSYTTPIRSLRPSTPSILAFGLSPTPRPLCSSACLSRPLSAIWNPTPLDHTP